MTSTGSSRPPVHSRSVSFQKMLELEKKYKLERLQTSPHSPPAHKYTSYPSPTSPPSTEYHSQPHPAHQQLSNPHPPLSQYTQKDQRSGSFSKDQQSNMMKAVRRSVALPALSISTAPPHSPNKSDRAKGKQPQQLQPRPNSGNDKQLVKLEGGKNVKFVAPEDDAISDDEGSICQSPTWEGYKEAEKKKKDEKKQKKKEKEHAAKEAKQARKRLTARLSKSSPSLPGSKEPSPTPHNRKLLRSSTEPMSIEYPMENHEDMDHALSKLTGHPYLPSGKRPPSKGTNSFVGGVKYASQSEDTVRRLAEVRERVIERDHTAAINPKSVQPKPFSVTSGSLPRLGFRSPTSQLEQGNEIQNEREKERTKEHVSRPPITVHGMLRRVRGNSFTSSTSEDNLPESNRSSQVPQNKSTPALIQHGSTIADHKSRGRPGSAGNSHTRLSREQSSERVNNGSKDGHGVAGFFRRFRSSSQPPNKSRQVETATPSSAAASQSAYSVDRTDENSFFADGYGSLTGLPLPPGLSSPSGSASSSQASLRNLSPAKVHIGPGTGSGSPTFSFASNMSSYFENQPQSSKSTDAPMIPEFLATPTLISEFDSATKSSSRPEATVAASQSPLTNGMVESRASERSSASSYSDIHDVSPPVSPATTPDTSRPQSRKGVSLNNAQHETPGNHHAVSPGNEHGKNKSSKNQGSTSSHFADPVYMDQHIDSTSMSNLDLNEAAMHASTSQKFSIPSPSSQTSHFEDPHEPIPKNTSAPTSADAAQPTQYPTPYPTRDISFLPPLKHQSLGNIPKVKSTPKPDSRVFPVVSYPSPKERSRSMSPASSNVSRAETLRSDEVEAPANPASYLQEARKNTLAPPPSVASMKPMLRGPQKSSGPRQSPVSLIPQTKNGVPDKPMSKMLVECCNCKFLHDMPSKVYECMVSPDSFVEDKRLGVSGAITTMVKCPWCSHNMRRECCAGYMALVMLQKRLH